MTKILLTFTILFVSCFQVEIKPREVIAQSVYATHVSYQYKEVTAHNMTYGIWFADYQSGASSAVAVVNLTKDALEIELLKKQLGNDKNTSK